MPRHPQVATHLLDAAERQVLKALSERYRLSTSRLVAEGVRLLIAQERAPLATRPSPLELLASHAER